MRRHANFQTLHLFWILITPNIFARQDFPRTFITDPPTTVEIGETVCFEGEGYDEDGDETEILWALNGEQIAQGPKFSMAFEVAGVFRLSATALADNGSTDPTPFERWIFVNDPEVVDRYDAPSAAIIEPNYGDLFPATDLIHVEGTGYDPEGGNTDLYWAFDDGTLGQGAETAFTATHPCDDDDEPCTYTIYLFARSDHGLASWYAAQIDIAVFGDVVPPDAQIIEPAEALQADGDVDDYFVRIQSNQGTPFQGKVAQDTGRGPYTGLWTFYPLDEDFNPIENQHFQRSGMDLGLLTADDFPGDGFYEVCFDVLDGEQYSDPVPALFLINVRSGNLPPEDVAIIEPEFDLPLEIGEGVSFYGHAEDEDSPGPLSFDWRITRIDDGAEIGCLIGEYIDEVSFQEPGLYRIDLEVRDELGAIAERIPSRYLVVYPDSGDDYADYNPPPEVKPISPEEPGLLGPKHARFPFKASAEDEDGGSIAGWYWDFGNGLTAGTANPGDIQFKDPGFYQVRAYARDNAGLWSPFPADWDVFIYKDNIPPNGRILTPAEIPNAETLEDQKHIQITIGTELTFSGEAIDPDGDYPLSLFWLLDDECIGNCENGSGTVSHIFDEVDTYYVELAVIDSGDQDDPFPDYREIQVVDPNLKPETYIVEPAADLTVEPGEAVYFFGFAEDPNDLDIIYRWDFGENARIESELDDEEVYPVYFDQPSPPGSPYVVRLYASTSVSQDESPAEIRITVKRYEDGELEPNDTLSTAATLAQGTYSALSLGESDGVDVFRFQVENSDDLRLDFNAEVPDAALLQLYFLENETWNPIDLGPRGIQDGVLQLERPRPGNYALEIRLNPEKRRMSLNYGISVRTLKPALFIPLMVKDGNLASSFGIINTTGEAADVSVVGLDDRGKTLVSKSLELPAKGRFFAAGATFFGKTDDLELARKVTWLKVQSTSRLVGYTNAVSADQSQVLSVGAVTSLSDRILIPHIAARTETWYTRAVLVNASETSADLDFNAAGNATAISRNLVPGGRKDFRFTEIFNNSLPEWGIFQAAKEQPGIAGFNVFGRVDGKKETAALEMIDLKLFNPNHTRIRNNIYFTHVARPSVGFWTGLALINTGNSQANYNLIAYDDNGGVLESKNNQSLNPYQKLLNTTDQLFPGLDDVAWIAVETDDELAGFELFGDASATLLAGFRAESTASDRLYFPHIDQRDGKAWTGITLLNVGTQTASLTVTAYNDAGTALAVQNESLAPGRKLVRTAAAVFSGGLPNGTTYIEVQSDQNSLMGFELFGSLKSPIELGEQLAGLRALRR